MTNNYVNTIQTHFKTKGPSTQLELGSGNEFNHVKGEMVQKSQLLKEFTDSFSLKVTQRGPTNTSGIDVLKLTNQNALTWDDHWVNTNTGRSVDPLITEMNLQRNSLVYVNMSLPRVGLSVLNLEGNVDLSHLYIHYAPNLRSIRLDGCKSLQYVALGENRSITYMSLRGCNLPTAVLEKVLRDFKPTITSNANISGVGMFRKTVLSELDLRGNVIDWSNRKVSSKIRLLLTNNWVVRWDSNPPPDVIPPAMYGFFVESRIVNT